LFSDWKSCKLHQVMVSGISTMADRMSSAGYQLGRGLLVYADSIIMLQVFV